MVSSPPRSTGSFSIIRRNHSDDVLPLYIDSASLQSPLSSDSSCSSNDSSLPCSSQEAYKPPLNRNHSTGSLTRRSHRARPLPTTWDDIQRGYSRASRSSSKKSSNSTRNRSADSNNIVVFLLGGLFFCAIWAGFYLIVNTYLKSHDAALKQSFTETEILPMTRDMEAKVSNLERENKMLQDRYQQTIMQQQNQATAEDPRLLEQIQSLNQKSKTYKQSIQKLSKYAMLERFGPGPHHVEIEIAFDPASGNKMDDGNNSNNKIILELAKPDEMPHSVFWFLEQVTRGLFDGASFHRNAVHVVQGGPHTNFMSAPNANPYHRFQRSGFEHVMFQEYHSNWSHQPYTIGYAGRPAGGPDFYFNMLDNAHIHGPGGQASVEAEPCFGKVIAGFDLVDRIHGSPVQPGPYHALEHNVAIVKMRLMEPSEPSLLQLHKQQQQQQQPELPNTATL